MEYQEMLNILDNQDAVTLHSDDSIARQYLGEELVSQIESLLTLAKENGCKVFSHGTFDSKGELIINEGFHFFTTNYTDESIQQKYFNDITSPDDIINNAEATTFYGRPALKKEIKPIKTNKKSAIKKLNEGFLEENDLLNKFCYGLGGNLNSLVNRKMPQYYGAPFTSIVFMVVPNDVIKFTKEYYYVSAESNDFWGDETDLYLKYYFSDDIDKECFIGYLDVPNKKFVINESFDMNHLKEGHKQKNNQIFEGLFNK